MKQFPVSTLVVVPLVLLSFCELATAQDSPLAADITKIVAPYESVADFMGVVGVQRDGEAPLLLPFGRASVELDVPHRQDGIFMIGSISKQFTAAAILLLEEQGALQTSDRVSKHIPEFPRGQEITVEQLLTHTSGVADIYSLQSFGDTAGQATDFAAVIEDLGKMPLTHEPGETYAYSNGGYALLAAIIERASGKDYGTYLASRIFEPLGMTSTAHDQSGAVISRRVRGYDPWGRQELSAAVPVAAAFTIGSGSLWSCGRDLLVWTEALHNGSILSDASYKKLTTDHGHGYGYGVSPFQRFGRDVVGHDGRVSGYASDLARYVDDRLTIVLLSNVQSVARDEIRRLVAAAVFGESYRVPEARQSPETSSAQLQELVGIYSFGPSFDVSISLSSGRLLARANQGGYSELIPLSDTEWFSRMLYANVRFARNEQGSVDRLIWGRGDGAPVGRRTSSAR